MPMSTFRCFWRCELAVALVVACALAGCAAAPVTRVVLVVVDTLRPDHLGVYGYPRSTSPSLDRRAGSALVFERALTASSWTLPAFGSLLTGMWPSAHGAGATTGIATPYGPGRRALDRGLTTLPERLQACGFATGAVVNNPFLRPSLGLNQGFDTYDYRRKRRAERSVDRALAWINERQAPWFLVLHLIDPHMPYAAPEPFRGRFGTPSKDAARLPDRNELRARAGELDAATRRRVVDRYDEEVAYVDHELGRFFDALEEREIWGRTLVVFTSDHGEEFFEHGGFEHGHAMHQELLHVPLVVWGPGVQSGRISAPVSVVDLPATILEATECETAAPLEVESSLWATLRGITPAPSEPLVAEGTLWGADRKALISWPDKLIASAAWRVPRLFDLASDPGEREDRGAAHADRRDALLRRLEELTAIRPSTPGRIVREDELTREALKELGYVD